jgi:hypothetical protein
MRIYGIAFDEEILERAVRPMQLGADPAAAQTQIPDA